MSPLIESEAARILADPAEHEGGQLVEVKSGEERWLARILSKNGRDRVEMEFLRQIVPDKPELR